MHDVCIVAYMTNPMKCEVPGQLPKTSYDRTHICAMLSLITDTMYIHIRPSSYFNGHKVDNFYTFVRFKHMPCLIFKIKNNNFLIYYWGLYFLEA